MDESGRPTNLTSTLDLLGRARAGDQDALNELFKRNHAPLRRWARGRLPRWTRDMRDTEDLVQETLAQTLKHIDSFEHRHEGALQAYMRQALLNRVRDEVRRVNRYPAVGGLDDADQHAVQAASPLEEAIGSQAMERYEAALGRLRRGRAGVDSSTRGDAAELSGNRDRAWQGERRRGPNGRVAGARSSRRGDGS